MTTTKPPKPMWRVYVGSALPATYASRFFARRRMRALRRLGVNSTLYRRTDGDWVRVQHPWRS